ncbi:hypothetical protein EK21DRAFT_118686 [Setomelanomma holmii]|uniref:Uncharacterized protein n=1 Tax=Setomelanomma holmii TaxID=210430 RepID=A0A9P4GXY2_9PLEO|nr:hypothetical protein EK21DRAFT_118686 [Setomelanomma holmii]
MVAADSFEETIRRQWQQKPLSRPLPGDAGFTSYREDVIKRLTSYCFAHPLLLRKSPDEQRPWDNWLEYLIYEQWHLEELTADADYLEEQFHNAMQRLLKEPRCSSRNAIEAYSTNSPRNSAQTMSIEGLKAAIDTNNNILYDLIREIKPHANAHRAVFLQRRRVAWVATEARSMETAIPQRCMTAGSMNENKKRRRDHHDDMDETRPTKIERHTTPERPQTSEYTFSRSAKRDVTSSYRAQIATSSSI